MFGAICDGHARRVIDLRYPTQDNFTKTQLYPVLHGKLRRAVSEKLVMAAKLSTSTIAPSRVTWGPRHADRPVACR